MRISLYERRKGAIIFIKIGFLALSWNCISGVSLTLRPNIVNFFVYSFLIGGILCFLQAKLLEIKVIKERPLVDFLVAFGPLLICIGLFNST